MKAQALSQTTADRRSPGIARVVSRTCSKHRRGRASSLIRTKSVHVQLDVDPKYGSGPARLWIIEKRRAEKWGKEGGEKGSSQRKFSSESFSLK
eukprot:76866-Rhodomonas_salina.3